MQIFLLFLFLVSPLFAYEPLLTENDPSFFVEGVSVISGDYYDSTTDYVVRGTQPITMPRSYNSLTGNTPLGSEHFFGILYTYLTTSLYLCEPNGMEFVYTPDHKRPDFQKDSQPFSAYQTADSVAGIVNTAKGRISAQTNVKNYRAWFDKQKSYKDPIPGFTLHVADGTMRRYGICDGQQREVIAVPGSNLELKNEKAWISMQFRLNTEQLPNGNRVHYVWKNNDLKQIYTTNAAHTKIYATLNVDGKRMRGSDGGFVFYEQNGDLLTIRSSQLPDQNLEMRERNKKDPIRLLRYMAFPQGRRLEIGYEGHERHRIQTLSQPLGPNEEMVRTHHFSYHIEQNNSCVLDAYGNKTVYSWNDQLRPRQIERFDGKALFNAEQFVWEGTQLKCKWLFDENRKAVSARTFAYDRDGNVLEETLFGNLSGQGASLQMGRDAMPTGNGIEISTRKNTYNDRNLNICQEDQNGLVTVTEYRTDCCLPARQQIYDGTDLKIEKIFDYDEDLILVRETIRDGEITLIKETTPRNTQPFIGMPEIVDEKDGAGKLLRSTVLHYNASGLVDQTDIYDANRTLRYSLVKDYDDKGRVIRETNALGQEAFTRYDELGNVTYEKDFSGRLETLYTYDLGNRLIKKEQIPNGGAPRITLYEHNHRHHLVSQTDPYGNEIHFACNPFGQRVETELPPILDADGSMQRPVIRQTWDHSGNEVLHRDPQGNTTKKHYNAYNKPIRVIHPDRSQEEYAYSLDGALKSHLDPEGILTSYTYDALSHMTSKSVSSKNGLLAQETFEYTGNFLKAKVDAEGNRTSYTYDTAGRKASEEFSGETILYFYDELGRQTVAQKGDLRSIVEYDLLNRVVEERAESLAGEVLRKERYEYDESDNRKAIIRFVGDTECREGFRYDAFKRLVWKQDALGFIETIVYEDQPHRKTHTDAMGLQTIETYDAHGRICRLEKHKGKTLALEERFYDLCGQLVCQVNTIYAPDGSSRCTNTLWEYDNRGRLTVLTEAAGTPEAKITRHSYTPNGKKATTVKPNGVVLVYTYHDLGHLVSLISSDGTVSHQMAHNRLGHLLTSDGAHRTPDARGRTLLEVFPQGHSIESSYDCQGRRSACRIPQADCFIEYAYGALDLQSVTRKTLDGRDLYSHQYSPRDLAGNLSQETLISSKRIDYCIDALCRRTSVQTDLFNQTLLEFDPVGNIRRMQIQGKDSSYTYDDLYQLTQETGFFTHTYVCDSLYNRLQKDNEAYEVNALNELISHCEYDLNGNPLRKGDTRYAYDALDRLIRLEAPGLVQVFTYDSEHRCLSKTTVERGKKQTLYFLYDDKNEIGAFDEALNIQELRILGHAPQAEIGAAIAIELQRQPYVPIHDLQGNVAVLSNFVVTKELSTYYRYSAFGEEKIFGSTMGPTILLNGELVYPRMSPWRFSSKRSDRSTGLVYYGRRFYVPELGRWLTPDPLGFADGMNLYAFVHNDPLTHLDLYGLLIFPELDTNVAWKNPWMSSEEIPPWQKNSWRASPNIYFRNNRGNLSANNTISPDLASNKFPDLEQDRASNLRLPLTFCANMGATRTPEGLSLFGHGWMQGVDESGESFCYGAYPEGVQQNDHKTALCKRTRHFTIYVSSAEQKMAQQAIWRDGWTYRDNCIDHVVDALIVLGYPLPDGKDSFRKFGSGISCPYLFRSWIDDQKDKIPSKFLLKNTDQTVPYNLPENGGGAWYEWYR